MDQDGYTKDEVRIAIQTGDLGSVRELFYNNSSEPWSTDFLYECLCSSLECKQRDVTVFLIRRGCPVNNGDQHVTPLHMAIQNNDFDIVHLLLTKGANMQARNAFNENSLKVALEKKNAPIIELILKTKVSILEFDSLSLLPYCMENGFKSIVRYFLDKGADVNVTDKMGKTALHYAAEKGYSSFVKLLLRAGAPIDSSITSTDQKDFTPLYLAIENKDSDIVFLLLRKGAKLNINGCASKAPLHLAVHKKNWLEHNYHLLLHFGANINVKDSSNKTPLHIAIESGCYDAVSLLLLNNADVNIEDVRGKMPLHFAVENGFFPIGTILQRGALIDTRDKEGQTPLHIAIENRNISAVEFLLQHGADVNATTDHCGESALHIAVKCNNLSITELILKYRIDIHAFTDVGKTALHLAVETGNKALVERLLKENARVDPQIISGWEKDPSPLFLAARQGHTSIAKMLLTHEANVDAEDVYGNTVLHVAVEKQNDEIIELVLERKPSLERRGNIRALSTAILTYRKQCPIVDALCSYGFKLNPEERNIAIVLNTCLQIGYVNIVEQFLICNAEIMGKSEEKNAPLCIAIKEHLNKLVDFLIKRGSDCSAPDRHHKSPMYYAVKSGNHEALELLLTKNVSIDSDLLPLAIEINGEKIMSLLVKNGADVNAQDSSQESPIYRAVKKSNTKAMKVLFEMNVSIEADTDLLHIAVSNNNKDVIRLLLDHGADVNCLNKEQKTPLHCAMECDYYTLGKFLVTNGASVNAQDKNGQTPLHIAATRHLSSVKMLIDNHANVHIVDLHGNTALHSIAGLKRRVNNAGWIIHHRRGGDQDFLNLKNREGDTALLIATRTGNGNLVKILVDSGASIECRDELGNTVLHLAAQYSSPKTIDLLLNYYINISRHIREKVNGKTVIDIILEHKRLRFARDLSIMSVYEHFLKRKCAKLLSNEDTTINIPSDCRINTSELDCILELNVLKQKTFPSTNISLYCLLEKSIPQITTMLRNETIAKELAFVPTLGDFPIYGNLIKGRLVYAKTRKLLIDKIYKHVHLLFPMMPFYCSQEIFNYLDNEDLHVLVAML